MVIIHKSITDLRNTRVQLVQLKDYIEGSEGLPIEKIDNMIDQLDEFIETLVDYEKDLEYGDKPHYSEFEREDPIRNDIIAPITIEAPEHRVLTATAEQYRYLEMLLTPNEYALLVSRMKPLTRKQASTLIEAKKSSKVE